VADFDDEDALSAALTGIERAYLVTPSSELAEAQQIRFAEIGAQTGLEHLVVLSQLASAADSPVRFLRYHAAVEERIAELGVPYTFLRPNLYDQGLFAFRSTIATEGRFFAPIGEARISAVDVRDIGAVAAAALAESGHENRVYDLTGPAAITHGEMAAALTAATGREISFVDVPPADFAAALDGVLPEWQVGGLIEDYAHYSRGEAAAVSSAIPDVLGRPAISFEQFARDHAAAFGAA